jgi:hypothetical protein
MLEAAFRGDDEFFGIREEGFRDQRLADMRTVRVSRIDQRGAQRHCAVQRSEHRAAIPGRAECARPGETHGAEADSSNRKIPAKRHHKRTIRKQTVKKTPSIPRWVRHRDT